jgi:uncharacterized paraquat-inducible protein A
MKLRKCPSCHDEVGAESEICPRCGVSFKAADRRRILKWTIIVILVGWLVWHYFHFLRTAH